MNTELLKQIIVSNRRIISEISLIKRAATWDNANYVLVGIRQSGKSYMLYQRIQELTSSGHSWDEILYINFDDERLIDFPANKLDLILQAHYQLSELRPVIFLDEIQNIAGWEHFARRLANEKYRVYITGSNAKMLSAEIATTLGGRYVTKEIYPYSFREYLEAKGVDIGGNRLYDTQTRNSVIRELDGYFHNGGFPESIEILEKRGWIQALYQKIFLGDMAMRHNIRNAKALRLLMKKLAESIKQPTSYTRLANIVSTAGQKIQTSTVIDYIGYAEETWLLFAINNYAGKSAERESNRKYYFIDNGILNLFLTDGATSLLENIVAVDLKRRFGEELCFYNKGTEVDFLLPGHDTAIQVCYSLQNEETRHREISALVSAADRLQFTRLHIVTYAEEETIVAKGRTISVVPLWKWLLSPALNDRPS